MSLKRSLGLVVVLTLAACRASTIAVTPEPIAMPAIATPGRIAKAEPAKAEPASELTEVVELRESASFVRLAGGPVLIVEHMSRAIYETKPDGSIRPFAPFGTYVAERARPFMPISRIAGVWPAMMNVELLYMSRTEVSSESFSVDIANGKTRSTGKKTTVTAAMPWKDGRVLAFTAESGAFNPGDRGTFYVARGPAAKSLPRIPAHAQFYGEFVAYPSGVVVANADLPPREDAVASDEGNVYLFADGIHPKPQTMPASVSGIVRGRVAEETLVYGQRFVRRYDGLGWADIALPLGEDIRALIVDDDGIAWIALGEKLYQGALPSPQWREMPLPAGFVPTDIAATSSRDLWVKSEKGSILHRGPAPAGPPFEPAGSEDAWVAELTRSEPPHAYFDGCQIALLVLGDSTEMTPSDASTATEDLAIEGEVVEGKLGGTKTYGFLPYGAAGSKERGSKLRAALVAVQKKHPHAKLVCGRMLLEAPEKTTAATP